MNKGLAVSYNMHCMYMYLYIYDTTVFYVCQVQNKGAKQKMQHVFNISHTLYQNHGI